MGEEMLSCARQDSGNLFKMLTMMQCEHSTKCMQVESGVQWGKKKMEMLMKRLNLTKPKYVDFFQAIIMLTNFLHKRCMDLTYEVVGDQNFDLVAHGQHGHF